MRSSHAQGLVRPRLLFAAAIAIVLGGSLAAQQIIPGSNVNMVSGTKFPTGDPFLQRQNEPSLAVSTRNPLHLLGGANDYRTVDLPGPFEPLRGEKMNADAWLGLFKSFDGGRTWQSTLLPGFPQDVSAAGLASPIKGRQAATDGVVKSGTNGLFYYAGLAFDRGTNAPSTVFVARFIDHNNREAGDPIEYLGTKIVDSDTGTRFLDKTALAVDVPRAAATCTIPTRLDNGSIVDQTIPAGNVYVAYSAFTGSGLTEQSQILFSRSTDCGNTWSAPVNLSAGNILNQNAQIAINPTNGQIWVSWRRVKSPNGLQSDGIFIARSIDGGATFSRAVRVAPVVPFDQGTSLTSFRTNAFQTMTVDAAGRLYVAWPERGHAVLRPDPVTGDSRIVVSTSTNGSTWTTPKAIETQGLGHQLMPQLTFHGGKLRMIFYDLREDVSGLFEKYIDELPIITSQDNPRPPRHTMDVYIAQALPAASPAFTSVRLSDYAFGTIAGATEIQRLQYNPPNLPLFRQGTVPFMGDYIDLAPAPAFVQGADGTWRFNTDPTSTAVSHGVWTDNRDVRPPIDGHWENYTPVMSESLGTTSLFDPRETVPPCFVGQTGMRNQNIYTAKVTEGLFVGAPGNTKPLGSFQRGFVITVENSLAEARSYRLQILNQPPGGQASFQQFSTVGAPLTVIDATVPPFSTIARTVYATSTETFAKIDVAVNEIAAPGAPVLPGGQSSLVTLNADSTTPSIQNPSIQNPSIQNPSIQNAEVYNPAITTAFLAPSIQNPSIQNPSIQNPSIQNPSIQNPELSNDAIANPSIIDPSIQNPSIQNPSIQNPSIQNPSIQNQDLVNGAIQDTSWVITNDGNTTASYAIKLLTNSPLPSTFKSQLVLHKTYKTPSAQDCVLAQQPHTDLIANITDPTFIQVTDPSIQNPSIQNPSIQNATISLAPGESANVTLRIVDPNRFDAIEFDAGAAVAPAAVAHSVNSEDAAQGITTPPIAIPMTITTATLASAAPGGAYSASLATFASAGTTSWSVTQGSLPPGITLNPATGQLSGTPTTPGNYVFTVQVVDANGNVDVQTLAIKIDPVVPNGFSRVWNGADNNWNNPKNWSPAGVPTATDDVYVSASIAVSPTLTSDVTIHNIVVEDGATVDTNGFTLTLTGNGNAGNTIVGTGTVVMSGVGIALGTFPNLTIAGEVMLGGPLVVSGNLTLLPGAGMNLNGFPVTVAGQLVANAGAGTAPRIIAEIGLGAVTVGGLDVDGLTLSRVSLTVNGGALTQFDNVRFLDYTPQDEHLTLNHPGGATAFSMNGLSFFTVPTTGHYIQATDTTADGQALVVNVSASMPGDGSARSTEQGGAEVNWLFNPADASIGVTQYVDPTVAAVVGFPVTYTVFVRNGGPATATNVVLNNPLPSGASFVSATPGQGTCGFSANTVSCSLGSIAPLQTVVVTIVVTPTATGSLNNVVTVTATESDPGTSDNAQTVSTPVFATTAVADLSITKSDSADPVPQGSSFSYSLVVSNAGPATASNVLVFDELPAGVTATTAATTKGLCSVATGRVTCQIASLAAGETATITINVTASGFGITTNTASVFSLVPDPNGANNSASETTFVGSVAGCSATFRGPLTYGALAGPTTQVFLADMDDDGDLDIVATQQAPANGVSVLLNNGQGSYAPPVFSFLSASTFAGTIADFNGDGDLDMVVGVGGNPNTLRVLLGNGSGALTQSGSAIPVSSGFFVESLDADGDGDRDLITRGTSGDLVLLKNNGSAVFDPPVTIYTGAVGLRAAIGDFNEDGKIDIVISRTDANFTVLLGNGAGGFTASGDFATASIPRGVVALGDLNRDGHLDIGVAEGLSTGGTSRLTLRFGTGTGSFGPEVDVSPGNTSNLTVAADVNGDGNLDLITNHAVRTAISVQLGNGAGGFGAPGYFATTAFSNPAVGDVDGDGKPDIVSGDEDGTLGVLLNNCGRPSTELGVTVSESADPINENGEVVYTVSVANSSATAANNVVVGSVIVTQANSTLPPNTDVTSTTTGVGGTLSSAPSDGVYFWTFPTVLANSSFQIEFRVRATAGGSVFLTSTITSDNADTNSANNTAFETTTVTATGRDLVVTNTNDSGPGSLRQAILDSNSDIGDVDRIVFDIPGNGSHTIVPLTSLPGLNAPVVLDATTQPGFGATPIIELNGNGLSGNGLLVTAGGTTVRGVVINRFGGSGIRIQTDSGAVIAGNFIGTDITGTIARPNGGGGILINSSGNRIGGTTAADRNLVSGNTGTGILMSGATATNNQVIGNFVGTDVAGASAIPNTNAGVQVITGSNNVIGGTTPAHRNVISGNTINGVSLRTGATGNRVEGNYIGLNAAGAAALPNASVGVFIGESPNNTIGGIAAGAGNVISGNGTQGVGISFVSGTNAATGNLVQGNFIGTNPAGTAAISNGTTGVAIGSAAFANTVGGTTASARNVISGNTQAGVGVSGSGANNLVQGNYIGLAADGTAPLPNASNGIFIDAPATRIGGATAGARNIIGSNGAAGIALNPGGAGTSITGNYIGTDVTGTLARPNNVGIGIHASNTAVGGPNAGEGNLISGNTGNGIGLWSTNTQFSLPAANSNLVQGNLIGTNAQGTAALPNTGDGIFVGGASNIIGGTTAASRNVISGNANQGIDIGGGTESHDNRVEGNYIGTNVTGTAAMPNGSVGIGVHGNGNLIGGAAAGAGNLVSGNVLGGIGLWDVNQSLSLPAATNSVVRGNLIGTNAAGNAGIGNAGWGIFVGGSNNAIGGTSTGHGNVIAFNGSDGVASFAGTGNAILGNAIFSNTGIGIDLQPDGVTANDAGDADSGPNNLQNFPVITSAVTSGASTVVNGTLNSTANTTFRVEFFTNSACDASGNGEGQTFVGSTNVTTDAGGNASFSATVNAAPIVTATATDPNGNTSEFSACTTATGAPAGVARAYVVHPGVSGNNGTLSVIDSGNNTVVNVLTLGQNPQEAAITPDGSRVWVTNFSSNNIFIIDIATNQIAATVSGTSSPIGLAFNTTGSRAYVASGAGVLYVIDTATNAIAATVPVGGGPNGLAISPDSTRVYVANRNSDTVSVVDTATNTVVATVTVGDFPVHVAVSPNGSRVYVSNYFGDSVSVIDSATNGVVATIASGNGPEGIAIAPDGSQVYVAHFDANVVVRIDPVTNTVVGSIPFSGSPDHLRSVGGNRVYAGAYNGSAVRVIDTSANTVIASIPTDPFPLGIAAGLVQANTQSADLSVTLADSPDPAPFNSVMNLLATATNNSPSPATSVTLTIVLPTGYALVSTDAPSCTSAGNTITCPVGTLAPSGTFPVNISVRVNTLGSSTATARVHAAQSDPQIANNTATQTTTVFGQATTFTVTNTLDSGPGSLRQAMLNANASTGTLDTIAFNIQSGSAPFTIAPASALPTITDPVIIDGTTQPGFTAAPIVELNGGGAAGAGLQITAGGSTVRGLVINRFAGAGILLSGGNGNTITGNYVGLDATGTVAQPNGNGGISVSSSNNTIGGTTAAARNVVSGNAGGGINLNGGSGNIVRGNYVGLNAAGSAAVGNGAFGIALAGSQLNTIGGTAAGAGNVVAGSSSINISVQSSSNGNVIQGNFVGMNATGTAVFGSQQNGIYVVSSNNNQIGGTTAAARNVIAGHSGSGQVVFTTGSANNVLQGNYIGTNAAGTASFSGATVGIQLTNAVNNTIGGTTVGAGNVISGNGGGLVFFATSTGNTVAGNLIGTAADGAAPLPNNAYGISIQNSTATGNTIGGTTAGAANVIAFNTQAGVLISAGSQNLILRNSIYSNSGLGIDLGVTGITANDTGDADTGANNQQNFPVLTSASTAGGLTTIQGTLNSTANTLFRLEFFNNASCDASGNGEGQTFVGTINVTTDGTGNAAFVTEVPATTILTATATDPNGNTSEFSSCRAVLNPQTFTVINTNDTGPGSLRQAIIDANNNVGSTDTIAFSIGTGAQLISPLSALPIITDPVIIDGTTQPGYAGSPLIELNGTNAGGSSNGLHITARGSTIRGLSITNFGAGGSGNGGAGIAIVTGGLTVVEANRIGVDPSGTLRRPNRTDGVWMDSPDNRIGGTAAQRNIISGNDRYGVVITGPAAQLNTVASNYIGLNAGGTAALQNLAGGIVIGDQATANVVGGESSGPSAGTNVISGNTGAGIEIASNGNFVRGNTIGLRADFGAKVPNTGSGILISGSNNTIGSGTTFANVITGNGGEGIRITAGSGNVIRGNLIGPNPTSGLASLTGNGSHGIFINSSNTVVGGLVSDGNQIQVNGGDGVRVAGGTGNQILFNSIRGNSALGIDLAPAGVTANDAGDADAGANNLQNFPVITSVTTAGGSTTITGTLSSAATTAYRVQFFSDGGCDATGSGEGQTFRGETSFGTDASGNASFNVTLPVSIAAGQVVTATATDPSGNTSEFSPCRTVSGTLTVSNTNDSGAGSLRQAIIDANATTALDTITFNIAGAGVHTITPITALPTITNPVIIDGTTQAGYNGTPLIELDGNGLSANGLVIGGGSSTVRGLAIGRFVGFGISLSTGGGNVIAGNFIGTDATGTLARPTNVGIVVSTANNIIGGTSSADRNLISGNALLAMNISGASATNNQVIGNFVGTDVSGTVRLANNSGIKITTASNNVIGGTTAAHRNVIDDVSITSGAANNRIEGNYIGTNAAGTAGLGGSSSGVTIFDSSNNTIGGATAGTGNLISGNGGNGVAFLGTCTGNTVAGNLIGIASDEFTPLPNALAGINVQSATATANVIGGTTAGARNVIAFNTGAGVALTAGTSNRVLRNVITSNGGLGIDLGPAGVTANDLGDADTGPNNLQNFPVITSATSTGSNLIVVGTVNSAASTAYVVQFFSDNSCDTTGNGEGQTFRGETTVTTDGSGNAALNVQLAGFIPAGSVITATATDSAGNTSEFSQCRAVVANLSVSNTNDTGPGSLRQAITDANATTALDTITFNIAGSGVRTITPASALPTITNPIVIDATTQPGYAGTPLIELNGNGLSANGLVVTAGGSTIRGLAIGGFSGFGIQLSTGGGNVVEGNYIGTDATGGAARANNIGIVVRSSNNTIGGTSIGARNVVSANTLTGIQLDVAGATGNVVLGNYIGVKADGAAALGNGQHGVFLDAGAQNNTIGGTAAGAGNVISGNGPYGVGIFNGSTQNVIQGNLIGTNAAGTAAIPNGLSGVGIINSNNNTVGGTVAGARNVLSGNASAGVFMTGSNGTLVRGNFIGTDITGAAALANANGVIMDGSGNVVGGNTAAERNVIAFNTGTGVRITAGGPNSVLGNSIHSNGALGIDLGNTLGVTQNDTGDADVGANNLQNYPVLTSAISTGGSTTIVGTFDSAPFTAYRLQFFSSAACDASTNGEGQVFIGEASLPSDENGDIALNVVLPVSVALGHVITATATDPAGNTSEFSQCRTVTATAGNVVSWINTAGGNWSVAANWQDGDGINRVPTANDDVAITLPGIYTVTLNTPAAVKSLSLGGSSGTQTLNAVSTLDLASASAVNAAGVVNLTGTLTGTGNLTVTGTLNWTGGSMTGGGITSVAPGGLLNIGLSNAVNLFLSRTLNNSGTAAVTSTSSVERLFLTNGTLNNQSGGVFDLQADRGIAFNGGTNAVNNSGIFRKSAGTGTSPVGVPFNNTGTVQVQSGTLSLNSGGTSTGTFTAAAGTTLAFGGGTHDLQAASNISAAGATVSFSNGNTTVAGSYNAGTTITGGTVTLSGSVVTLGTALTITGTANINSASTTVPTLTLDGTLGGTGSVTVTGTATWTSGSMTGTGTTTVASGAALNIQLSEFVTVVLSRTLNNAGTATVSGTPQFERFFVVNGTLNNQSGGIFDLQTDRGLIFNGGTNAVNNSGTFRKSAGTGTSTISIPFNNTGTLQVLTGGVSLNSGGTSTGAFTASAGTTIAFGGGTHDLQAASSINASGATVSFSGGTTTVAGSYNAGTTTAGGNVTLSGSIVTLGSALAITGTATINGTSASVPTLTLDGTLGGTGTLTVTGAATWTSGSMTGTGATTIAAGATLNIQLSNAQLFLSRTLNNAGTATLTGTAQFERFFLVNGILNNQSGGLFDVQIDRGLGFNGGTNAVNNSGIFRKSGGTGTTTISSIPLNNAGSVQVQSGTLSLNGGGTSTGAFSAAAGTTLVFGGTHNLQAGSSINAGSAVVNFSSGTTTITGSYNAGTTTASGTVTLGGTIVTLGSTLTITGTANINGASVTVPTLNLDGTLGGSGTVTVTGIANWSGGSMSGTGVTAIAPGATMNVTLSNTANVFLSRTLNNGGTIIVTSTTTAERFFFSNGTLNNQSGALFDMRADRGLNFNGGTNAVNNSGTFRKSVTTGSTSIGIPLANAGLVELLSGSLSFNSDVTGGGTFSAGSGTTLSFGSGTHDLQGGAINAASATVNFAGGSTSIGANYSAGTTNIVGTVAFNANATLQLLNLTGTLSGTGNVSLTGTANWSGGSMTGTGTTTVAPAATLNISLADTANVFLSRTLNNAGTVIVTSTSASERFFFFTGTLNNQSGAVVDLRTDRGLNTNGGVNALNNSGTFRKSVGSGVSSINVPFNNAGVVDLQTGTLRFTNGGTSTGAFNASSGTTLHFDGGTHNLEAGSNLSAASAIVRVTAGTTNLAGGYNAGTTIVSGTLAVNTNLTFPVLNTAGTLTGTGTVTVTGVLNWTGGSMTGAGTTTIASGATLNIPLSDFSNNFLSRTLNNSGTAILTSASASERLFFSGGTFNNQSGGLLDLQTDRGLSNNGGTNALTNSGTFRKSVGSGTSNVGIPFTNAGTVEIQTGALSFTSNYVQTAGVTRLVGGNLNNFSLTVNIQGGVLEGAGTVTGNLSNAGTIRPGNSAGCLTVSGNYTQTVAGSLEVEIGGPAACAGHDQLQIGGTATLAGSLTASLIGNFAPSAGQTFQVMTFASRSGTFASVNGPFTASYNAGNVTLTADAGFAALTKKKK